MKLKQIIAILLLLSFAAGIFATLPIGTVNAQPPAITQKTYAIIDAIPNPVGVGEETLIKTGILQAQGSVGYGWSGLTVTVVKPDGTTTTLGPLTTDSTGSTFTLFTPDQVGTYQLTTHFPDNEVAVGFFDLERNAFVPPGTTILSKYK